jgi:hypothetical protein
MDYFRSIGNFEELFKNKFLVKHRHIVALLVVMGVISVLATQSRAQGQRKIIQLSGFILSEEDTSRGLPGVHIYVPKAGRGTTSNYLGYFSMPVLEGDEIVISAIGYERQYYKIPSGVDESLTIIIEMADDITYLEEVRIMPFPTEEVLKEAVLALNLPNEENQIERNLNEQLLALMVESVPMDGAQNARWYLDNWAAYQGDRFGPRPNPLLNPFNWARFFKDLKKKK